MTFVSRILVPVDFSPGSRAAVKYAAALAQTLHSTVTLLHVYELPSPMSSIVPGADKMIDAETERALAQSWLESLRIEAKTDSDVDMRVVVMHGGPVEEIVSFSREGGLEMIVMGTHGRTGLQHVLMGSVAEAVVRRAPCPVLTIHLPVLSGPA
jgi:nucleotide-binding universal stress UspA family protein